MILLSYNLYSNNKTGDNGKYLNFKNIIRNIFDRYEDINIVDISPKKISKDKQSTKSIFLGGDKEKEVFNINENNFTYDEAKLVCKALGSELATYGQVVKAHKKGANWCNYGWSKNKMALYPIQKEYYDKIQKDVGTRNTCGKPGVNGGYFDNKDLKFGVNCYGIKPKPNPDNIIYIEENGGNGENVDSEDVLVKENKEEELVANYKNMFNNNNIDLMPFNNAKWSTYSFKKSKYIIPPKSTTDYDLENNTNIDYDNVEVEMEIESEYKDPRNF